MTTAKARLLDDPLRVGTDTDGPIHYQHSVLWQTCPPFHDPGTELRLWQRKNGHARLEVQAGRAYDNRIDDFVDVGLPFA